MKRRQFLHTAALTALAPSIPGYAASILTNTIPSTGEALPTVGLGTWITFNVGRNQSVRDARTQILGAFLDAGGTLVDSSPMYGSAEEVVGYALDQVDSNRSRLFSATKVWTRFDGHGQIDESFNLWGSDRIDLYQVHNLVKWRNHLAYLRELKQDGRVRYIGVTTSHGRRHDDLVEIIENEALDFVQLTYNAGNRAAEARLLPAAKANGTAVIANRPFEGGLLVGTAKTKPLPLWIGEAGCVGWPDLLLKYIASHPAMTCAIPATSRLTHLHENMLALRGSPLANEHRKALEELVATW